MALAARSLLLRGGAGFDSAAAAVEADARVALDHSGVVGIVNDGGVYAINGSVVSETAVVPAAAFVAISTIAVAVVDATGKADRLTPITFMEGIRVAAPAPITRSPYVADFGRLDPVAGNPVIAVVAVSPIAGRPEIAVLRADGLLVNRQHRWCEGDGNADLTKRSGRHG